MVKDYIAISPIHAQKLKFSKLLWKMVKLCFITLATAAPTTTPASNNRAAVPSGSSNNNAGNSVNPNNLPQIVDLDGSSGEKINL